jgi:predicted acetyltransferase
MTESLLVRAIGPDELPAYLDTVTTAFLERPDTARVAGEVRTLWDLDRVLAAFDGERICGTFRTWATELTLPGNGRLPAAAVAGVTVLPTHRRRGILRRMVAAAHAAMRDRSEPLALLYAAEYPIYGRFGYGPACTEATWTLDASATGFHGTTAGHIELVEPNVTTRDAIQAVFEAARVRRPGEIWRRDHSWDLDLGLRASAWGDGWKGFVALHRDESGAIDGFVRYHPEAKWEQRQPRNTLGVDDLHALTDDAYIALWRFLADVDWVTSVKAPRRSAAERLPWLLTNARAAAIGEVGDGLWVRLLDVPRALAGRTYAEAGDVVLEIADPDSSGGRTRIRLETGPEGADARITTRAADLSLDVSALGAAYLGGVRLRDAVAATGFDEHRPGALAEAERLFRSADPPWCSTFF